MKKQFRDFESARKFVRGLKLKGSREWYEYCKSGNKPDDISTTPRTKYPNKWKGWGDWLGTGRSSTHNMEWRSFKEAREFVGGLNLKGQKEWKEYCKSGNKPDDIPADPNKTYKNDFKGMGDWLGTGTVPNNERVYRTFEEARKFAISLNLKGQKEWGEYCKSGNKPDDIHSGPRTKYPNKWKGWGDWLGTEYVAHKDRVYRTFEEARKFVRSLGLKNSYEWKEYCKSGNKPDDIPADPSYYYKKYFKGIGDWLGTGNISPKDRVYRTFEEARKFVRSLGLKNWKEWGEYCKSGNKPDDIPAEPNKTYKNDFIEMGDWLGTGRTRNFRPFTEAREFVQKLGLQSLKQWNEYCKSGNKPDDIPAAPWNTYKEWKK